MDIERSLSDQVVLLDALNEIIHESIDADSVRSALIAMTHTEAGLAYMAAHPVTL